MPLNTTACADSTHWNALRFGYAAFNGSGLASISVAAQAVITTHIIAELDISNGNGILESIVQRAVDEQHWDVGAQSVYAVTTRGVELCMIARQVVLGRDVAFTFSGCGFHSVFRARDGQGTVAPIKYLAMVRRHSSHPSHMRCR